MATFTNIADFKTQMAANPGLQNAFKNDPVAAADSLQETPLNSDKWIYRIVVGALGLTIILIIVGVLLLIGLGHFGSDATVPTILTAIGSAAIGALAGLLAPSPKEKATN